MLKCVDPYKDLGVIILVKSRGRICKQSKQSARSTEAYSRQANREIFSVLSGSLVRPV